MSLLDEDGDPATEPGSADRIAPIDGDDDDLQTEMVPPDVVRSARSMEVSPILGEEEEGKTILRGVSAPQVAVSPGAPPSHVVPPVAPPPSRPMIRPRLSAPPPAELLQSAARIDDDDDDGGIQTGVMPLTMADIPSRSTASPSGLPSPPPSSRGTSEAPKPIAEARIMSPQVLTPSQYPSAHASSVPPSSSPLSGRCEPTLPPPPSHWPPPSLSAPPRRSAPVPISSSVPPASVASRAPSIPAHFMVAAAPYPEGSSDSLATAPALSRAQRSALPWAAALVGLAFVVGGAALRFTPNDRMISETVASFIDPSRADAIEATTTPPASEPAVSSPPPVATPAQEAPAPSAAPLAVPPVAEVVPVVPPPVAEPPPPSSEALVATPSSPPPESAAATTGSNAKEPAPESSVVEAKTPDAKVPAKKAALRPAPKKAAPAAPAPAAPAPKPAPKPAPEVASVEDKPVKPAKPAPAKKSSDSDVDEETRKALDALQKSQLESSF